jgi:hypothetical protein
LPEGPWGIPDDVSEYQLRNLIYEYQMAFFRIQQLVGFDHDGMSDPGAYILGDPVSGAYNYCVTATEDVRHFSKDFWNLINELDTQKSDQEETSCEA